MICNAVEITMNIMDAIYPFKKGDNLEFTQKSEFRKEIHDDI